MEKPYEFTVDHPLKKRVYQIDDEELELYFQHFNVRPFLRELIRFRLEVRNVIQIIDHDDYRIIIKKN